MRDYELKKKLENANPRLSMNIYKTTYLNEQHGGMCSVMYKGEHEYSMRQGDIPKFPNKRYGIDYLQVDGTTTFIRFKSLNRLLGRLVQKGYITNRQKRELLA